MRPDRHRYSKAAVLLAGLALACGLAGAQEVDLGTAANYSAFILGDASGLAKAEGRLAVGRNLSVANLELGSALPAGSADMPTLVVGRNVSAYAAGELWADAGRKGFGVYGSASSGATGSIDLRYAPGMVDFAAEGAWLLALSGNLKDKAVTGKVTQNGSSILLTGTNAMLEIFSLQPAQVAAGRVLSLQNVRAGAWIVLNVTADTQRQVSLGWDHGALQDNKSHVLYNFHDADVLTLAGSQVWGSLLAPYACVKANGGRVDGTVVAATWTGATVIGNAPLVPGP